MICRAGPRLTACVLLAQAGGQLSCPCLPDHLSQEAGLVDRQGKGLKDQTQRSCRNGEQVALLGAFST